MSTQYAPVYRPGGVARVWRTYCAGCDPAPVCPAVDVAECEPGGWLDVDALPRIDPLAVQAWTARKTRLRLIGHRGSRPLVFDRYASRERMAA